MSIVEGVTLAIALLGALLGAINTWNSVSQAKPRMRVRFLGNYSTPERRLHSYSIEVINLSSFPLTVREVGLALDPFWRKTDERLALFPTSGLGNTLPLLLGPREQGNFWFPVEFITESPKKVQCAYVKTSCGLGFRGRSPLLNQLSKRIHGKG